MSDLPECFLGGAEGSTLLRASLRKDSEDTPLARTLSGKIQTESIQEGRTKTEQTYSNLERRVRPLEGTLTALPKLSREISARESRRRFLRNGRQPAKSSRFGHGKR